MNDSPMEVLVLSDQEGSYYLLSRDLLERVRVPAEGACEVERLVQEADTAGFAAPGSLTTLTPLASFPVQRKAGKGQQEYLIYMFTDLLVSS